MHHVAHQDRLPLAHVLFFRYNTEYITENASVNSALALEDVPRTQHPKDHSCSRFPMPETVLMAEARSRSP